MTIEEAKQCLNYNIKEGVYDSDQFDGWTDEQLIEFAARETNRADAYWHSVIKEENGTS